MNYAEIGLTAAAVVTLINGATSLIRNYVFPKFGKTGVQVIVGTLAVVGASYLKYGAEIPQLQNILLTAGALFSSAVAAYEVIWSKIGNDYK